MSCKCMPRENGNPDGRNSMSKGMKAGWKQVILLGESGSFEWTMEKWLVALWVRLGLDHKSLRMPTVELLPLRAMWVWSWPKGMAVRMKRWGGVIQKPSSGFGKWLDLAGRDFTEMLQLLKLQECWCSDDISEVIEETYLGDRQVGPVWFRWVEVKGMAGLSAEMICSHGCCQSGAPRWDEGLFLACSESWPIGSVLSTVPLFRQSPPIVIASAGPPVPSPSQLHFV